MIALLHLNGGAASAERRRILRILDRRAKLPADPAAELDYLETFGYPEDLPDLRTLRPPGGNALAANAARCWFVRRENKELPAVY